MKCWNLFNDLCILIKFNNLFFWNLYVCIIKFEFMVFINNLCLLFYRFESFNVSVEFLIIIKCFLLVYFGEVLDLYVGIV